MEKPTKREFQIVEAMINLALISEGVFETPPHTEINLYELSLKALLSANEAVANYNKIRADGKLSIICDERLIAAIYTMLHYGVSAKRLIVLRADRKNEES